MNHLAFANSVECIGISVRSKDSKGTTTFQGNLPYLKTQFLLQWI